MAPKAAATLAVETLKRLDQADRLALLERVLLNACEPDSKISIDPARAGRKPASRRRPAPDRR